MATKTTYDETSGRITVEPATVAQVIQFTPKIILDMAAKGVNWTISAKPKNAS
jgi:hypothetical protein